MLKMTDEQKYSAVLKELGEVLTSKNTTISCQSWQIDQLKEKLKAAEAERDAATTREDFQAVLLLDKEAVNALQNINAALRACYDDIAAMIGDVHTLEAAQSTLASILPIKGGAA